MPYILNNTDGSLTVTVPDSTVDTNSFSLAIVGRSVSNYGQYFAQNTIRHLENFASETRPSPNTTLIGQLWYDKKEKVMRVWDGDVWTRNTGILVGPEEDIPVTDLTGGGTAFFNTSDDKLYIHNGNGFREASYPGLVTSEYSEDDLLDNPTFYGSRLRCLFLLSDQGLYYPVLALCYVKSTVDGSAAANRGATQIGQYYETIMSLYSDTEFTINTGTITVGGETKKGTATPVDGEVIDYAPELIEANQGIAAGRAGRPEGKILKGENTRSEYAATAILEVYQLFANIIGAPSRPVESLYVTDIYADNVYIDLYLESNGPVVFNETLYVEGAVTFNSTLDVTGNIETQDTFIGNGLIIYQSTSLSGETVINGDTTINDNTTINGNITITGDGTQNFGDSTNRIETLYLDYGNVVTLEAQDVTIDDLTVNQTLFTNYIDADLTGAGDEQAPGQISGQWTLVNQSSLEATFADLAEYYSSDIEYAPGTVVKIGGETEVTQTTSEFDIEVFGVVSTDPAYTMNAGIEGTSVAVALQGRVPVKVVRMGTGERDL